MIKTLTVAPLVKMFNMCPASDTSLNKLDIIVNGLSKGYIIPLECANEYAAVFLDSVDMQYNSTFYKTWKDVTDKTRYELLLDQVLHYMSTYGTNFTADNKYVPNVNPTEPAWNTYKTIAVCSFDELYDKCMSMLVAGIALKSDTVQYLTDYIIEYAKLYNREVVVDAIKNREALVIICDALNILPKSGNKLFAHIVYKTTGKTLIIKNREMRKAIRNNLDNSVELFKSLNEDQKIALAGVFNRYKQLFVAFKSKETSRIINKISHLSKKYHKPMVRGFWENCLSMDYIHVMNRIPEELEKATNFKLLQVMQSIRERLLQITDGGESLYIIRNGSIFVKSNEYPIISAKYTAWENIYNACHKQLVKNLSAKKCKVKFPEYYNLTCPTSEKNFIGDFPMGTYCTLGKESVIGIYWRNDWGTRDFDLSFENLNGERISWNSDYTSKDRKVIYSGDMTDATTGANEAILFNSEEIIPGIVNINRYFGQPGSKYRLFFGTKTYDEFINAMDNRYRGDTLTSEHMIDPNKLQFEADMQQGEASHTMIGAVLNNKFVFFDLACGYERVASSIRIKNTKSGKYNSRSFRDLEEIKKLSTNEVVKILSRKVNSLISLKDILLEAGFKESDKPDLDLTTVNRDTLIELFSK